MEKNHIKKFVFIIVIFVVVGGVLYFALPKNKVMAPDLSSLNNGGTPVLPTSPPTPAPVVTPAPAATDKTIGWKSYTNTFFGISLKYPKSWNFVHSETAFSEPELFYFFTVNGYKAIFGIDAAPPYMPSATAKTHPVTIGSESGFETRALITDPGAPSSARFEFFSSSLAIHRVKLYLVIPGLKPGDSTASFNTDLETVHTLLESVRF